MDRAEKVLFDCVKYIQLMFDQRSDMPEDLWNPKVSGWMGHIVQAIEMREVAIKQKSLSWYCAATWVLVQNWHEVMRLTPWHRWQGEPLVTELERYVVVAVAAHERMPLEAFEKMRQCLVSKGTDPCQSALDRALVGIQGDYVVLGTKGIPVPR